MIENDTQVLKLNIKTKHSKSVKIKHFKPENKMYTLSLDEKKILFNAVGEPVHTSL